MSAAPDRDALLAWWDEAWSEGVWWAAWRRTVEGLTAEQAAWSPAPGRHSIWQLVAHVTFWREYFVHRVTGGAPLDVAEVDRRNWTDPPAPTEASWRDARERFAASHALVREALADPATPATPKPQLDLRYLLLHDSYHVGQIMYLRALLGLPALES